MSAEEPLQTPIVAKAENRGINKFAGLALKLCAIRMRSLDSIGYRHRTYTLIG
jgi:hypothetical protein